MLFLLTRFVEESHHVVPTSVPNWSELGEETSRKDATAWLVSRLNQHRLWSAYEKHAKLRLTLEDKNTLKVLGALLTSWCHHDEPPKAQTPIFARQKPNSVVYAASEPMTDFSRATLLEASYGKRTGGLLSLMKTLRKCALARDGSQQVQTSLEPLLRYTLRT